MTSGWTLRTCINGPDGYFDWVLGAGGIYDPQYKEYEILISMANGATIRDLENLEILVRTNHASNISNDDAVFLLSTLYHNDMGIIEDVSQATGRVNHKFIQLVNYLYENKRSKIEQLVADIVLGQVLPADAVCDVSTRPLFRPVPDTEAFPPDTVVIGIIDEGIAFGHERFRNADGTSRVEAIWLQDARCEYRTLVPYGREICRLGHVPVLGPRHRRRANSAAPPVSGIDELLRAHSHDGVPDDAALYRAAGLTDFRRPGHKAAALRVAHGTHVMDLAAGYEPVECRRDRPIIAVQLPTATVADTSGIGLQKFMLDAVTYILRTAERMVHSKVPVVINFSSGMRAGPHDGTSPIEAALDARISRRNRAGGPTSVVLPAGNSYLASGHAQHPVQRRAVVGPKGSGADTCSLTWRVQPDDRSLTFLEVWLPYFRLPNEAPDLLLTITPPGSAAAVSCELPCKPRYAIDWNPTGAGIVCKAYYENKSVPGVSNRRSKTVESRPSKRNFPQHGRYLIALAPTSFHEAARPVAPAGEWKITLINKSPQPVPIHAWIHWDDRPLGYPRYGRQSYFVDPFYERFDYPSGAVNERDNACSNVRRLGTLNAIATSAKVITVAGYQRKNRRLAPYSSAGPALPGPDGSPPREGPDAAAVSDESRVVPGVLAAGAGSGSYVALNGTSVAAPQVTRYVADRYQAELNTPANPGQAPMDPKAEVRLKAESDEARHPDAPAVDAGRMGAGRMILEPASVPRSRHLRRQLPDAPTR